MISKNRLNLEIKLVLDLLFMESKRQQTKLNFGPHKFKNLKSRQNNKKNLHIIVFFNKLTMKSK
jgi:hypothetical protein